MSVRMPQEAPCQPHDQIDINLAVLRATDEAHRCGLITGGQRYHILQSMFPPVEQRISNVMDFATCTETPAPGLSAEDVSQTVVGKVRKHQQNADQHLMLVNS